MKIDWFTIIAQALNFLILVWLMRHFLYRPILNAIDAREKKIAAELASADQKKAEAKKESDDFKEKNEQFNQQRTSLLKKATDEAQTERQRLLEEARKTALDLGTKSKEALRTEEHNLQQSIRLRIQTETFAIARKALTDLAGASLEERMVDLFLRRLHELSGEEKKQLVEGKKDAPNSVLVRTSSDLLPPQRALTESAIKDVFGAEAQIKFETAPDLISGIELRANGHKTAWNIEGYLTSLEKDVNELFKEKNAPDLKSKVEPRSEPPKSDLQGKEHGV